MEYFVLIFVHVFCGIMWAGSAVVMGLFIIPSVMEAGPAGGAVMAGVVKRRFPIVMTALGILVVLSGVRLYMLRWAPGFVRTPEGLVITLGALLAIGALVMGIAIQKPTAEKLGKMAGALAASGKPPTPEQMAEMQALRAKMQRIGKLMAFHLIGAAALMALHRFAVVF
jgi:uncharacterized membrane protein